MDKEDTLVAVGVGAVVLLFIFIIYSCWHEGKILEENAKACVLTEDESPECKWAVMKYQTEKRNRTTYIHTGRW